MPENPALPSLVRDLSSYADDAGVGLVSVAPSHAAALGSGGASTSATSAAAATAPIQQIQTHVVTTGSYAELTLYLQKLQSKMRRAILVENLQLAKAERPKDAAERRPADDDRRARSSCWTRAAATQAASAATAANSTGNAN